MMSLAEAAEAMQGVLSGAAPGSRLARVSTDTRNIQTGDLFFALQGEHYDAHDFLADARDQGAAALVVSRPVTVAHPCILVDDTRLALGRLAAWWRGHFDIPCVAVTGSNGKTTVKNMIAAILGANGDAVLATRGNLNNDIGVPLTLFGLTKAHHAAVIEMGMNHPGEIATLSRLARPTVATITNAAPAHLAGLGNVESVARAKGEIFSGLRADGTAVLNADDPAIGLWRGLSAGHAVVSFGLAHPSDVSAEVELRAAGSDMEIRTPAGSVRALLPLPGRHNVMNALAATACALAVGANLEQVARGLAGLVPEPGRLEFKRVASGARLIDDSYNANPASLAAAVDVLVRQPGVPVLVLGDMGELGGDEVAWHQQAGEAARAAGVQRFYSVGDLAREASAAFGAGACHFHRQEALIELLASESTPDWTILIKGSRSSRMDRIVAKLTGVTERTH